MNESNKLSNIVFVFCTNKHFYFFLITYCLKVYYMEVSINTNNETVKSHQKYDISECLSIITINYIYLPIVSIIATQHLGHIK